MHSLRLPLGFAVAGEGLPFESTFLALSLISSLREPGAFRGKGPLDPQTKKEGLVPLLARPAQHNMLPALCQGSNTKVRTIPKTRRVKEVPVRESLLMISAYAAWVTLR